MRQMRLAIVSAEQKHKCDADAVKAHEDRSGDPTDPAYARTKQLVRASKKERATKARDTEEGHVSRFDNS